MADQKHDDVNITNQTSDEKSKKEGYTVSDVQQIYEEGHPKNWDDVVKFIEKKGDKQWHITPGEVKAMKDDFQKMSQSGGEFINDPKKAFDKVHGGSSH